MGLPPKDGLIQRWIPSESHDIWHDAGNGFLWLLRITNRVKIQGYNRNKFDPKGKGLILVHNHPSGDPTPSEEDILLTQQLCLCGKVLGIEVVDHVIIGISGYTSFKKRNLM